MCQTSSAYFTHSRFTLQFFSQLSIRFSLAGYDHRPSLEMRSLRAGITEERKLYSVQCIPLLTLLLAMGNPTVDYLSLDIEGAELPVLRTIPFDKIDVRTLSVEVAHSDRSAIRKLLREKGFRVLRDLKTDIIFVKK